MIRASISTLSLDVWDVAVLVNNLLDEVGKVLADEIGNDTDTLWEASIEGLLNESGPTAISIMIWANVRELTCLAATWQQPHVLASHSS